MAARADDPRPDPAKRAGRALSGFVLLLDDVTQSFAQEHERDSVLHSLTEGNRASLAAMRNAVQQLRQQAGDGPLPEQLLHLVQEEMGRMGERIDCPGRPLGPGAAGALAIAGDAGARVFGGGPAPLGRAPALPLGDCPSP